MLSPTFLHQLQTHLPNRVSVADDIKQSHSQDESSHPAALPDAVCFPENVDDVVTLVNLCREQRVPMVPFGVGSSVEGATLATHGGVCVDMTRMNQILRIGSGDLDVTLQAGVRRYELNDALKPYGLFFPIDPGANATLGGMVSTRASGTNAVRYGTMRDNVLALQVVLANGEVIRTGSRARKSSAGYDLTRLFTGAEGTLGIITEITLKAYPLPEEIAAAVVSFPSVNHAVQSVMRIMQNGIPMARIELLDDVAVRIVSAFGGLDNAIAPTLFMEFHGTAQGVREHAQRVNDITNEFGGSTFKWAQTADERAKLWHARHNANTAVLALRPNTRTMGTDVCVPISRLADCILETKQDLLESPLVAPIVGHVGDGNFHVVMSVNPHNEAEMAEAQRINERVVQRALSMGGTCTGEHGVGIGKRKYMHQEHGAALGVMRTIKHALDPLGLMNPGKVLPD